ncbi:Alcohol dehydrogenase transcription factor Myb/SANT-like [Popillia japonica]|uniref:Alcohol dehydrogenase transcription factor Myb/SANT-like n=1 Tax=Popillia japonica TaxID=7064 RepID=A0AAW1IAG1_POPJA
MDTSFCSTAYLVRTVCGSGNRKRKGSSPPSSHASPRRFKVSAQINAHATAPNSGESIAKPNSKESTVKAKWKNLRDTFRREFRKIPILRSGDSGGTVYEVSWPYYKSLLFLKDQFISRNRVSNIQVPQHISQNIDITSDEDISHKALIENSANSSEDIFNFSQDVNQNISALSPIIRTGSPFTLSCSDTTPPVTPSLTLIDIFNFSQDVNQNISALSPIIRTGSPFTLSCSDTTPPVTPSLTLIEPALFSSAHTTITTQPDATHSPQPRKKRTSKQQDEIGDALIRLEEEKIKIMKNENKKMRIFF